MQPATVQSVRYAAPKGEPAWLTYAADFMGGYMGAKQQQKEAEMKQMAALLPALAAQGQLRPSETGKIKVGPQGFDIVNPQADENPIEAEYKRLQAQKLGIELGAPGYTPSDVYLENLAWDEADKQLNRNSLYQLWKLNPNKAEAAEALRRKTAQETLARMKAGYSIPEKPSVEAPKAKQKPPVSDDKLTYARKQLKRGNVLVWRDGVLGQVPKDEVLETDYQF